MRMGAAMETTALPHRRLDELVLDALASFHAPPQPVARPSDVSIEIVLDDHDHDEYDIAVTNRFVRMSMPYERVELDLDPAPTPPRRRRPTTFARTIRARPTDRDITVPSLPQPAPEPVAPVASQTQAFEAVWFDASEDSLSRMLAAEHERRARSWIWLAISIAVAAVTTAMLV
jgi:hypothetical protein